MNRKATTAAVPLGDMRGTVEIGRRGWIRRLLSFSGPAYLVSVGYMDPGNWATDIEGGARFGYALIWVLLMSNLMAILLQTLSARLGIVTGHDLAQGCRREYPRPLNFFLWLLAEIAIAACDLAEVLGTIIGLNLLFGLPLLWGCVVTLFDTFLLLAIQRLGVRKMEAFILMLVGTIGACFLIEVFLAKPDWGGVIRGVVPHLDSSMLYITIGIIGATVMPHNLYLHSSLVQSRKIEDTYKGKAEACRFNLIDSGVALNAALFVNAAILITAAATFFSRGIVVTEIQQAHALLERVLGPGLAPVAFAIALLAAGQSSTLTGTLAGQVVMEGFLNIRLRPWLRRLVTRSVAIMPAVVAIILTGDKGAYSLLILSQVVLSLQLPFAIIPLIQFTSDARKMGAFANRAWVKILAWLVAAIIVGLNLKLVYDTLSSGLEGKALWITVPAYVGAAVLLLVLALVTLRPLLRTSGLWSRATAFQARSVARHIKPVAVRHIGVALEHSNGDAEVLSVAVTTARQFGAHLTLLHVIDTPGTMVYGSDSSSMHRSADEAYMLELKESLEGEGLSVDVATRSGEPAEQIIAMAREARFDMLVLGSHGHRGIADVIHGQTVTTVRHAVEIPVLVVRMRHHGGEGPGPGDAPSAGA
ncbi:MAG TPA: Nramp family divalent metal transporter [Candidatus Kapabacteria bacterium]|nr:Nramp family divalent metal transporter [Candidatus Kapabacteria bacterium]